MKPLTVEVNMAGCHKKAGNREAFNAKTSSLKAVSWLEIKMESVKTIASGLSRRFNEFGNIRIAPHKPMGILS